MGLVIVGGFFTYKMLAVTPEKALYQAIENQLSTKYIGQLYTTDLGYMVIKSDTHTDFSNPAKPRTTLHDTYKVDTKTIAEIQNITTGTRVDYSKAVRITSEGKDEIVKEMYKKMIGRWVKVESENEARLVDPYEFAKNVNQTQDEFLVGNYPTGVRSELRDMYKKSKVFTYDQKKVKTERVDGKSAFKYELTINKKALAEVNKKAEESTEATVYLQCRHDA